MDVQNFTTPTCALSRGNGGEIVNFSETLKRLMETKGVSKYRLAKDLGVSQSSVANWLSGRKPHPFMVDKVYAYFGRSVTEVSPRRGKATGD